MTEPMRALVYRRYGPPERLSVVEMPRPEPGDDDVLVRVRASSLNSWDYDLLAGTAMGRIGGPFRPAHRVLGADIAGEVVAVGANVTRFAPGDAVMGDLSECGWGGLADYACAGEAFLAHKPGDLSFEAAAAIPQAGSLALQGLDGRSQLGPGKSVLINGAGGGMGSFAIQLAKHAGAEVTGVDRGDKAEFMRALGADHVLDYTQNDFTRSGAQYDLIVDAVARRSVFSYARALRPGGAFFAIGGAIPTLLQLALLGNVMGERKGKTLRLLMWQPRSADFRKLAEMAVDGTVVPAIDQVYPLEKAAEAFRRLGAGDARGKLVIRMD